MSDHRWKQISRLYHAGLARDESQRAEFLDEACGEDDELRREVESLLAQERSAEGFLSAPAVEVAAKMMAEDGSQPGMWGRESEIGLVGGQIGGYQILSRLGAGGMGEVYRARDSQLGRDVAIKVLPSFFASDAERLRRFEREARMLASLSHPHIGAIYGVENAPAGAGSHIRALIMELVDGPTLAERLTRGPVPIKEALKIGQQIAKALEAAHEKGIIHRDLKPANIMLTRDGDAKVLDFGLARAFAGDGSAQDSSDVPTVTDTELRPGAILGTPAYMSPEQARGQAIDKRTDIWAFGCVLYEMLTGRPAFPGETISDTIAVILEREPTWTALPQSTPGPVRRLLAQCLDKDPKRRLRDIGQARIELDDATTHPPAPDIRSDVAAPTRRWRRLAPVVGLALLLLAGGVGLFYSLNPPVPVTSSLEYTQITNFTDSATAPSLSPDGRMVTFLRGGEAFLSYGQIYVKQLPNGESVRLTNDANRKFAPVFTPDGSRVAYSVVSPGPPRSWDTFTVPVLGGQPTRLLPNATGLTWLDDQHVLFSENRLPGLHMGIVTATEGRAQSREIYFPAHERGMAHYAYASPDGKSVLVVEMDRTHVFNSPCRLVPFDGSSVGRAVGPPGSCTSAAWSPDGQWMYFGAAVGGSSHLSHLWRQNFPDGIPEQVTFGPNEQEGVTVAPDGRSLITSVGLRRSSFWIHDAAGERALSSEGFTGAPRLSGDGSRVFYLMMRDLATPSAELRSLDLASGASESVVPGMSVTDFDISRDEKEVAFTTTDGGGESTIWLASLQRERAPRLVARAGDQVSFGANGDLIFRSLEEKTNLLVRIKKDGTGREQIATPSILDKSGVSPDGEWVTLFSPDAGEDGSPATVAVPVRGGAFRRICASQCPVFWSSDGRFFYIAINRSTSWSPRASWARSAPAVGSTLAIPVPAGQSLPDLPVAGIRSEAEAAALPGIRVIEHGAISPGSDPSTYVFTKTDLHRNLFRIPLG